MARCVRDGMLFSIAHACFFEENGEDRPRSTLPSLPALLPRGIEAAIVDKTHSTLEAARR